jgi:4-hydroxy-tetrahydrodipicolinate synthase
MTQIEGIWIPLVTPFKDGGVDLPSYKKLVDHYIGLGVQGLIPLGTTGESPTISDEEYELVLAKTMEYADGRLPVIVGLGGNNTAGVVKKLSLAERYKVRGILSVCPYYNRPDQKGIYAHFKHISESTHLDILVYNIPYRTGRNIENTTIRELAALKNVVGIKDSCGDIQQSAELLLDRPADFAILTGEDTNYFMTLTMGGNGGILASAHLHTEQFLRIHRLIKDNDHQGALAVWRGLAPLIPLLFQEPNPAPLKYCLYKLGLIQSGELRLPLTDISDTLREKLLSALSS